MPASAPNPRRVAAGKKNRQKRKGLSPAGRERLRRAAPRNQPWRFSTGPRTPEGKARSAANGKLRQKRVVVAAVQDLVNQMAASRRIVAHQLTAG